MIYSNDVNNAFNYVNGNGNAIGNNGNNGSGNGKNLWLIFIYTCYLFLLLDNFIYFL